MDLAWWGRVKKAKVDSMQATDSLTAQCVQTHAHTHKGKSKGCPSVRWQNASSCCQVHRARVQAKHLQAIPTLSRQAKAKAASAYEPGQDLPGWNPGTHGGKRSVFHRRGLQPKSILCGGQVVPNMA